MTDRIYNFTVDVTDPKGRSLIKRNATLVVDDDSKTDAEIKQFVIEQTITELDWSVELTQIR